MKEKKKKDVVVATCLKNVKFATPDDAEAEKKFPNLYECLCPVWEDGKLKRIGGRIALRVEGGAYMLTLECETEGVQTTIAIHSLPNAFGDLEAVLKDGKANWGPTWKRRKKYSPSVDDVIE